MAIDVFSIPVIWAKAERLFSLAKLQIDDQQASLKATTIKTLECMKSWLKAGWYAVDPEIHEYAIETPAAGKTYRPTARYTEKGTSHSVDSANRQPIDDLVATARIHLDLLAPLRYRMEIET